MTETVVLQQFARFPRVGQVKTRLQAEFSADEVYAVHCELMRQTAQSLADADLGAIELWLDELAPHPVVDDCRRTAGAELRLQCAGDLGIRMETALRDALERADVAVLVGSDCPGLDGDYLRDSVSALKEADVVFGPAEDGGFVLVACRRAVSGMFSDVGWGGPAVLQDAKSSVAEAGLSSACIAVRYDIDTPDDLRRWRHAELRPVLPGPA